jgi:hypothetical protein
LTILGWLAALTSVAYLLAVMIQSVALFNHPTYEPQRWQATLMMIAFGGIATLGNTYGKRFLPIFETLAGALHVYGLSAHIFLHLTDWYTAFCSSSSSLHFLQPARRLALRMSGERFSIKADGLAMGSASASDSLLPPSRWRALMRSSICPRRPTMRP